METAFLCVCVCVKAVRVEPLDAGACTRPCARFTVHASLCTLPCARFLVHALLRCRSVPASGSVEPGLTDAKTLGPVFPPWRESGEPMKTMKVCDEEEDEQAQQSEEEHGLAPSSSSGVSQSGV